MEINPRLHQRQINKLEAMGEFAGGIAHDLNNILGTIVGYAEMMELFDMKKNRQMMADIDEILHATNRAQRILEKLLIFSQKNGNKKKLVVMENVIGETLISIQQELPHTIDLDQKIECHGTKCVIDPVQIQQMLLVLCNNAIDAMKATGGTLEVTLEKLDEELQEKKHHTASMARSYFKLTVRDTGHGIEKGVIDRVFEPYFTTKRNGEGTGLGLSVAYGIVRRHGGRIHVESDMNDGTIITVFLPGTNNEIINTSNSIITKKGSDKKRILFIDDEKTLVDIGRRILTHCGYTVTTKTNSIEALSEFASQPEEYDLIITDNNMPRLNGTEMAKKINRIRHDIPIILCTGVNESSEKRNKLETNVQAIIRKPLTSHELLRVVTHTIGTNN